MQLNPPQEIQRFLEKHDLKFVRSELRSGLILWVLMTKDGREMAISPSEIDLDRGTFSRRLVMWLNSGG
jgi:hypothetical protein